MSKRSKNFATIIYPESFLKFYIEDYSTVKEWIIEILESVHVNYILSPIHDKDRVEGTNAPKKAHWHLIIVFDSLKSIEQAKEISNLVHGVGLEIVNSLQNYARYLVHMDNPNKERYNVEDVVSYGIDYNNLIKKDSDKYDAFGRILDYVLDNHVYSFANLLVYAKNNDPAMFRALCDNSYTIREFIKSFKQDTINILKH